MPVSFFDRSSSYWLHSGQQHSGIQNRCRVVSSTAASGQSTTISTKCSTILGEIFASGIASPAEHGADMVKPTVYPFKCREWDLATAPPACASNNPDDAARPVGLSRRERIAFARTG
jgi:hypothetical protein